MDHIWSSNKKKNRRYKSDNGLEIDLITQSGGDNMSKQDRNHMDKQNQITPCIQLQAVRKNLINNHPHYYFI